MRYELKKAMRTIQNAAGLVLWPDFATWRIGFLAYPKAAGGKPGP